MMTSTHTRNNPRAEKLRHSNVFIASNDEFLIRVHSVSRQLFRLCSIMDDSYVKRYLLWRLTAAAMCSVEYSLRGKSLSSRIIDDQFTSPCPCLCLRTTIPCPCPLTLRPWQNSLAMYSYKWRYTAARIRIILDMLIITRARICSLSVSIHYAYNLPRVKVDSRIAITSTAAKHTKHN